mmetsp:Transcript_16224/g.19814  ORF Transcript_16224/g.19814 Transcript_16224/m.19814 type:complete len:1003 (+) Transcript_16224:128-3136(+)
MVAIRRRNIPKGGTCNTAQILVVSVAFCIFLLATILNAPEHAVSEQKSLVRPGAPYSDSDSDVDDVQTNVDIIKDQESAIHDIITVPVVMLQNDQNSATSIGRNTGKAFPSRKHIPVQQLSIQDMTEPHHANARTKPLLLTGWNEYQNQVESSTTLSTLMEEENFRKKFGNYTQYVKDQFVQPFVDNKERKCLAPTSSIMDLMKMKSKALTSINSSTKDDDENNLLFFTNNLESPEFFEAFQEKYTVPSPINYDLETGSKINSSSSSSGFHVFSAMVQGSFHGFHKHDNAQYYQIHGRKMWWFLPPDTARPEKGNPCRFLTAAYSEGESYGKLPPENALSVLQQPGDTIYVPQNWWHATCALDDWTVAVGMQRGSPHKFDQKFESLPQPYVKQNQDKKIEKHIIDETIHPMPWSSGNAFQKRMTDCGVTFNWNDPSSWTWFHGDLNQYYNKLIASDSKRNPNEIKSYAVHRWMGKDRSTLVHYELIYQMIRQFVDNSMERKLNLLDAGCGLGAGLMWFETNAPELWELNGHTISSGQLDFINKLPSHKFNAVLKSYDDLDVYKNNGIPFDVAYSIEAFVHSPDEQNTLKKWSEAMADGGIIVIIDDFLSVGVDREADDVQLFSKSWMANVLQTTSSLADIAEKFQLDLIVDRDLGSEYQIIKRNYQNKNPDIRPTEAKNHQGWLGSGMRQRLMVEGKLTYRLVVFQKKGGMKSNSIEGIALTSTGGIKPTSVTGKTVQDQCTSVPFVVGEESRLELEPIEAEHRTGKGNNGGSKQECISGWYCCGKGEEWWNNLDANRTHNTAYLKLSKSLFGNYMDKMVENLNSFYSQLPSGVKGKFLEIGGTGSVSSGMSKVTSKFAHFAGPFDYWVLDSDPAAEGLDNALHCDMGDCPKANDCDFDVTFSHTVLEHSSRPWDVFDTIARVTKKGGLTMHIVPFSYQYHATPDDNFRFSHKALISLLEDRGFKILDVGYDICTKPDKVLKNNIDEHFDVVWLSYVVGQKL